jgi:hypothetical protein
MPREDGFVLIGVTMFILVLTILGLSLFSLSGFEGQFMIRSLNHDRAFNAAAGGIERARFALLAPPHDLETVKAGDLDGDGRPTNYLDGVDYAVAIQDDDPVADSAGDSTNNVVAGGPPVWIRVRARYGDASVVLQARYSTGTGEEYYRRLITAREVIVNNPSQVYLTGKVGQEFGNDMSWHGSTQQDPPGRILEVIDDPMALPQLATYLGTPAATIAPVTGTYTFLGNVNPLVPSYFRVNPQDVQWTVFETNGTPKLRVRGTVIWLVPAIVRAMYFAHPVTVEPYDASTPSVLVIAAGTQNDIEEIESVQFEGGFESGNLATNQPWPFDATNGVPIVIVSPGQVRIRSASGNKASFAKYLCIYSGRVEVQGPTTGAATHLWHLPSVNGAITDEIMDLLYSIPGILPNASVGGGFLTFDTGSWLVVSESTN